MLTFHKQLFPFNNIERPLDFVVENCLRDYARFLGCSQSRMKTRFKTAPLTYSLDYIIVITNNPIKAAAKISGNFFLKTTGNVKIYGFCHLHAGVIEKENMERH